LIQILIHILIEANLIVHAYQH